MSAVSLRLLAVFVSLVMGLSASPGLGKDDLKPRDGDLTKQNDNNFIKTFKEEEHTITEGKELPPPVEVPVFDGTSASAVDLCANLTVEEKKQVPELCK